MSRILILLFVAVFFSACHPGNSSLFMKRKYTKGVYFDVAKHAPEVKKFKDPDQGINKKNIVASAEKHFVEQKLAPIKNTVTELAVETKSFSRVKKKADITLLKNILNIPFHKTEKNSSSVQKRSAALNFDGATIALGCLGFILLSIVYTFSIMRSVPGINPLAAFCTAMLFAAITVVTGICFY